MGILAMKTFSAVIGLLGALIGGSALAGPAITNAPANLVSAPGARSQVLLHIPANAAVDVVDCQKSWCEISWRNTFGYVPVASLDMGDIPEGGYAPRRYYEPAPVYAYPPPVVFGGGFVIGPRPRFYGYHRH